MSTLCNTTLLEDLVKIEADADYFKILSTDPPPLMNGQCGPPTKTFTHPWYIPLNLINPNYLI